MNLKYNKTEVIELKSQLFEQIGVRVVVKREDLNHAFISGNKWWKLKYNLEEAQKLTAKRILTFGGSYSNHLFATAAASYELNLECIGVVRGEETLPLNSTLAFAKEKGMQLHYVSREQYRKKNESEFIKELHSKFGDFYLIPEGGTNELAVKGCSEFAAGLEKEIDFNYLCLAVGTGGTIAGMINGLNNEQQIIGFSSLKGGNFLIDEVKPFVNPTKTNWIINTDYHFGGYAKLTEELKSFIQKMKINHQLPLDKVYTAKMVFGVFDLIEKKYFKRGSTILLLHTGGLQGNYE